jgi:hypothetical protein
MDAAVFCEGGLIPDAVERCFERICEAAKKLGSLAEELCPGIRWHGIRGFGNFLRHEYDGIELELLLGHGAARSAAAENGGGNRRLPGCPKASAARRSPNLPPGLIESIGSRGASINVAEWDRRWC